MPTIAEKARAEAERAEAEEHEDEPTEEPAAEPTEEPAAEPEPHPGEGLEEPTDQMVAELQVACDEHHDRVHMIMGPFVEGWEPCETCNGIGIAYPSPPQRQLQPKSGTQECSVCKGEGELELPTKREQFKLEQCGNCNGRGWVGDGNLPPAEAARAAVESFPADVTVEVSPQQPLQPSSTDPRVEALRAEGFIVLEKPGS